MYVCICNNVTERDIREAVSNGAVSIDCLEDRLRVSTGCGQCRELARQCLQGAIEAWRSGQPAG